MTRTARRASPIQSKLNDAFIHTLSICVRGSVPVQFSLARTTKSEQKCSEPDSSCMPMMLRTTKRRSDMETMDMKGQKDPRSVRIRILAPLVRRVIFRALTARKILRTLTILRT
eukprot:764742-Hanusia_phi.AAC.2